MSVEVKINITLDSATPALQRKLAAVQPHAIATRIAPPLAAHWRNHLAGLPRNKKGYPSTGFWEEAARSVTGIALDDGALLSCSKLGVRQRLHGGTISAVHGNNLTIPICAEAYGTTVADWGQDNLTLVILADGRKFLALWLGSSEAESAYKSSGVGKKAKRAEVSSRRAQKFGAATKSQEKPKVIVFRGSGGGSTDISRASKHLNLKFLFALKPSVEQEGDPNVIPPDIADVARMEVMKAIDA